MIHIKIHPPLLRALTLGGSRLRGWGATVRRGLGGAICASLWITLLCAGPASAQNGGQPQVLPATKISAGMYNIRAEVADSPISRQIGLMHRKSMPTNDGMIFVFEAPSVQCFWMRNTLLPLSIAFIDEDGSIVNIADMQPMDETSHCSKKAVRFALEMNQGWFARRGFKAGDKLGSELFAKSR